MILPNFRCRSCSGTNLDPVISLGATPLANSLLRADQLDQIEARYPLDLVRCLDCALVQITETVPPEALFSDYLYFSSFSDTGIANAKRIVEQTLRQNNLGPSSLAVEVASNDGYLLQFYKNAGIPVLGIEPARNIAKIANERGIRTECAFFGESLATDLVARKFSADVIHANNVLAHVADTNGVVKGFATLLKTNGVVISESPYLKDTLDGTEFDQIYHEHLCYYSLTSLDKLFSRHGLCIVDVEHLPIHGGSLRIFAQHVEVAKRGERARSLLLQESTWVGDSKIYSGFAERVAQLKAKLVALLMRLKADGKSIAVYGASAKGSTLMNYFGIGTETIDFVADRSTVKQGMFTPGTRLPIVKPEHLLEKQPDFLLLLTWNFADEIMAQQAEYRKRGGQFIVPIPNLSII